MLQARLEVGKGVDVWSLGCVFSEVVTWVVFGLTELQHYRHRRRRELGQTLGLSAGHAFHDGSSVLISVVDNHKRLKEDRSVDDHLTPDVIDLINSMVAESQQRLTSQHAYQKSMRIIQKAKDGILEAIKRPVSYEMSVPRQATVGSDTTLIEEEPVRTNYCRVRPSEFTYCLFIQLFPKLATFVTDHHLIWSSFLTIQRDPFQRLERRSHQLRPLSPKPQFYQ